MDELKRVLVLGGQGMLGHKVVEHLTGRCRVLTTVRQGRPHSMFGRAQRGVKVIPEVDATNQRRIRDVLAEMRPHEVINCVGITKQVHEANDPIKSITINSLLPHQLAIACRAIDARLIQISTDCVFSGLRGMYTETDIPDPVDLYGRSKLLGEPLLSNCLTIRTSIIGRELIATNGLLEWFLSNRGGNVEGYRTALFSGLTTIALARVLGDIIDQCPGLRGLYHVSAEAISKYELITLIDEEFQTGVNIKASDAVRIDRSLDSSRFRHATGWSPPGWTEMIREMAADPTPYDDWRKQP